MPLTAALKAVALAGALAAVFGAGWYVRGLQADKDMNDYQAGLRAQQADQQLLKAKVEAADATNTTASTARIDAQQVEQQKEVQYVDREIIRYVRDPAHGKCQLPADWVRLYNESSGLPSGVPQAGPTGPAVAGASRQAAGNTLPGQ